MSIRMFLFLTNENVTNKKKDGLFRELGANEMPKKCALSALSSDFFQLNLIPKNSFFCLFRQPST